MSEHHPPSHFSHLFILSPSYFNDSLGKMHRPDTCPTALKSHKSRTPLVHHLVPFYFTVSRPGATDPRAKYQASAPSLPISLWLKSIFVTVLLTCNASARASGQKRCQTCEIWELSMGSTGVCSYAQPSIVVAGYLRPKPCRFLDATSGAVFLSASGLKTSESNINYKMCYAGRTWEVPAVKAICWRLKAPHWT